MSNTSPPLTSQTEDQFREPPDRRTSAHGPEWIDWWTYDSFEDAWNWVDGLPPGYEYKTREQIIAERLAAFEEHLGDAAHDLGQQILRFLDTLQEGGEGEEYATAESFTNFGADAPSGDVGAASGVNGVWIDTMDQVSPQEFVVTSTYKLLPPMRLDPMPISSSGHVSSQVDDMSEEDRAGIERMKEIVDVAKPLDTSDRDMRDSEAGGSRSAGTVSYQQTIPPSALQRLIRRIWFPGSTAFGWQLDSFVMPFGVGVKVGMNLEFFPHANSFDEMIGGYFYAGPVVSAFPPGGAHPASVFASNAGWSATMNYATAPTPGLGDASWKGFFGEGNVTFGAISNWGSGGFIDQNGEWAGGELSWGQSMNPLPQFTLGTPHYIDIF